MLIGVIADDFTGASDIANTLAKGVPPEGGLATAQYIGVPDSSAHPSIDAGVISLKSRSVSVESAVKQSLAALDWLKAQGCVQIVFKYCSTFDSTKEGNIGPVGEALAARLGAKGVIVCPSFPGAGRTVYQGHLFVFDQLLSESGMQNHPLTPMTDSDLRRWLAYQSSGSVGHVALPAVQAGGDELRAALDASVQNGDSFCVVDTVADSDLLQLSDAIKNDPLITGGSGIAMGLPRNMHRLGLSSTTNAVQVTVSGPGAILAGSCSGATREQVEVHQQNYPAYAIDVEQVMSGGLDKSKLADFVSTHSNTYPLVYSSSAPETVKKLQDQFGMDRVSQALDELFADTAKELLARGYTRLVIAGGETSSAVAQSVSTILGEEAMQIGAEIDPGVPVLTMGQTSPIALALKSGNFGSADFFAKAFDVMANPVSVSS